MYFKNALRAAYFLNESEIEFWWISGCSGISATPLSRHCLQLKSTTLSGFLPRVWHSSSESLLHFSLRPRTSLSKKKCGSWMKSTEALRADWGGSLLRLSEEDKIDLRDRILQIWPCCVCFGEPFACRPSCTHKRNRVYAEIRYFTLNTKTLNMTEVFWSEGPCLRKVAQLQNDWMNLSSA